MADVNVLVVFYSRYGQAEKLALAAGVGAIQARADIRLRRVADRADRSAIERDAAWKESLERMLADYVEPRPIDAEWADVFVLAAPADARAELLEYIAGLGAAARSLGSKVAAPIMSGAGAQALEQLCTACAAAGLTVAPEASGGVADVNAAREYGRRIVEAVRANKRARP